MVHFSAEEKSTINSVWAKVDVEKDGHEALGRLLVVYPWCKRYFSSFGDLSSASAVASNAKVRAHGKKVLSAIGSTIQHLDDVKHSLAALSKKHATELHVDPENFKRFGEVLAIVLSAKFEASFSPKVQAIWQKFTNVLVSSLSHGYC